MSDKSYFESLELDLPKKLLEALVELFEEMPSATLTTKSLDKVEEDQGVYQLFESERLVYIGKTDSDAGLQSRLLRHRRKIQGRLNLDTGQVRFKAVRVFVFNAMDLEALLIKHYREKGIEVAWQQSGFGSNDPGRNRDKSKVKEDHFDYKYPIDLAYTVEISTNGQVRSAAEIMEILKAEAPYIIRFQRAGGRKAHADLLDAEIKLKPGNYSIIELLKRVKSTLGASWQITALPGYVIAYKENVNDYPQAQVIEAE